MALVCGLGITGPAWAQAGLEAARAYRKEQSVKILTEFFDLLSIPNATNDPGSLWQNANHIRDALQKRNVRVALLHAENVPPLIFGEVKSPGARRTLGVYAHYDGQPVNSAEWVNPPWKATLYSKAIEEGGTRLDLPAGETAIDPEWRIYARSAADDKAAIMAVLAALDALRLKGVAPTANLVFLFDGEEESGSPNLKRFLDAYRRQLTADAWIVVDGPVHQSRRPQLAFGVRGICGLEITVYGAGRYLHSGHYGNWAPNPAMMLARLLASMRDDAGRVLIEGFYDKVESLGKAERAALASVPDIDEKMCRAFGLAGPEGDESTPYAQRLASPALNVRGLASATVGATARNAIPPTATASIDIRLVQGQEPDAILDLVEAHIRGQGYTIVRDEPDLEMRLKNRRIAKVVRRAGYPAARTSMDLPIVKQVVEAAERAAGEPVIRLPTLGGSLPLHLFTDHLKKPAIIAPIANHDNNQHGPNENMRIENLWYGIDLMGALFTMP